MLDARYDHKLVEKDKYDFWKQNNYFLPNGKKSFCIVMPPPNVTGKLHLGHAWDNTIQDIIIRRKRMQGYKTLFLPGIDHAGVATQAKIDEKLRLEGTDRFEIGRDSFMEEANDWVKKYSNEIRDQWKMMGISIDYSREKFTLSKDLSYAVEEAFIRLFNKGLIYRDNKIINWDVKAKTALSNIEVIHKETEGKLYYIKYPFLDNSNEYLVVATTRPETCFGDRAVMVNPNDIRYAHYVGKKVIIPNTSIVLTVIEDDYVDISFGTGVVKVTPAHDPNDFEVGKRHNLTPVLCMNEDGTMNEICGKYNKLDRFEARELLVKDLENDGYIEKIEKLVHQVGYSERTNVMVEPRLSLQWFVKMDSLSKEALKTKVKFVPGKYKNIFKHWMTNVYDWCISRQVWWGHRIPVYYKGSEMVVAHCAPDSSWIQDEDVLDTWFSSGLWPFTTLGWPDVNHPDFKEFFPNDALCTAYDIIFFWVSRMIFQSIDQTGKDPFKTVIIHGLVRDSLGQKMSKSSGNGVDPRDVIESYGVDALRYFLTTNSSPGNDLRYETEKVESSWNFINKLYNVGRFIDMKITSFSDDYKVTNNIFDNYLLNKLSFIIKKSNYYYDKYEFPEASRYIYNFLWDNLASEYVEYTKFALNKDRAENTQKILVYVFKQVLKLLHPFIPFVTEHLYSNISNNNSIMISPWPKAKNVLNLDNYYLEFFSIISVIRNYKNVNNIPPKKSIKVTVTITDPLYYSNLKNEESYLKDFLNASECVISNIDENVDNSIILLTNKTKIYLSKENIIDVKESKQKINDKIAYVKNEITRGTNMLSNQNFITKAKPSKIEEEQVKLKENETLLEDLIKLLKEYE